MRTKTIFSEKQMHADLHKNNVYATKTMFMALQLNNLY